MCHELISTRRFGTSICEMSFWHSCAARTAFRSEGAPSGQITDDFRDDGALVVRAKGNVYAESSPLTITARDESYAVRVDTGIEDQICAALGLEYKPSVAALVELKAGQINVHLPQQRPMIREWPLGTA